MRFPVAPGQAVRKSRTAFGRRKPSCSTCSRPRLRGARVRFPVVLGQVPCGRVGQRRKTKTLVFDLLSASSSRSKSAFSRRLGTSPVRKSRTALGRQESLSFDLWSALSATRKDTRRLRTLHDLAFATGRNPLGCRAPTRRTIRNPILRRNMQLRPNE